MMEKEFKIVQNTLNKKVLIIAAIYAGVFILGILNQRLGILINIDGFYLSLIVLIFITLPIIFVGIAVKNYKIIGNLFFNVEEIRIQYPNKNEQILIKNIDYLILRYEGFYGEDRAGFLGGSRSIYSKDGSGNILEFLYQNKLFKLNIAFESQMDFNSLQYLFNEIESISSIKPEIITDISGVPR